MIPFEMVMRVHRVSEMSLAQRDDPIEAFFFDRSHKSLGVRFRVWCPIRRLDDADPGVLQNLADRPAPFRIPAQIRMRQVSSSAMVSEHSTWRIKGLVGKRRGPQNLHATRRQMSHEHRLHGHQTAPRPHLCREEIRGDLIMDARRTFFREPVTTRCFCAAAERETARPWHTIGPAFYGAAGEEFG
jgi:hypothetical protein